MDDTTRHDIEQLLYKEARLLDERRFREWLELLTDDVHYWLPVTRSYYSPGSKAITSSKAANGDRSEVATADELALFDDNKQSLTFRIDRLETGMAWSEDPPSRTSHFVMNIEIEETDKPSEVKVCSGFITHRRRLNAPDFYIGRREDVLRNVDGKWKIAARKIVLDDTVMSPNLTIFL